MAQLEKGRDLDVMGRNIRKRASKGEIVGFYPSDKEIALMAIAKTPSSLYGFKSDDKEVIKRQVMIAYEQWQKLIKDKYYL